MEFFVCGGLELRPPRAGFEAAPYTFADAADEEHYASRLELECSTGTGGASRLRRHETDYLHDVQEKRDAEMERNLRMENSELPQSTPTNSELPQSTPTNQIEEEMEHMSKAYGDMASTPMQEEGRDEPVLPARDIMALDKEYITSYVQDHWAHSKRMTRSHKRDFERWLHSAKVAGAPFVEVTETDVASHLAAMKFPMEELSPPEKMAPVPIEGGPGQWFRLDVRRQFMHTMRSWEAEHPEPPWTFAVHGTSMRAAKDVLSGGWRESSNVTGGVHGLYCEGMHRRQCTIRYMTHAWEKSLPKWCVAAAMMELMVDRNDTKIVNSQWVQRNLGSVAIIAVLIHVVDLRKVYPAKFLGASRRSHHEGHGDRGRRAVQLRARPPLHERS